MDLTRKGINISQKVNIPTECQQALKECAFITEAIGAKTAGYVRESESRKHTLPPSVEFIQMPQKEKDRLNGIQRECAWRAYDSRTLFMDRINQ